MSNKINQIVVLSVLAFVLGVTQGNAYETIKAPQSVINHNEETLWNQCISDMISINGPEGWESSAGKVTPEMACTDAFKLRYALMDAKKKETKEQPEKAKPPVIVTVGTVISDADVATILEKAEALCTETDGGPVKRMVVDADKEPKRYIAAFACEKDPTGVGDEGDPKREVPYIFQTLTLSDGSTVEIMNFKTLILRDN